MVVPALAVAVGLGWQGSDVSVVSKTQTFPELAVGRGLLARDRAIRGANQRCQSSRGLCPVSAPSRVRAVGPAVGNGKASHAPHSLRYSAPALEGPAAQLPMFALVVSRQPRQQLAAAPTPERFAGQHLRAKQSHHAVAPHSLVRVSSMIL
jgi:hypothetical protein